MIGPFPYGVLPNSTHLSVRERDIWGAFMRANPLPDAKCFYDVEVGNIRGSTEGLKPEWEKNAQYLGKYKIDVVVETPLWVCVIEVKGEATTKALGEIWLYDELLREAWDIKKPVLNWIVTDEEMPNIRAVCEKEGVELRVVALSPASTTPIETTQLEIPQERSLDVPVGAQQKSLQPSETILETPNKSTP